MYELTVAAHIIANGASTTFTLDEAFRGEKACLTFAHNNAKSLDDIMHILLGPSGLAITVTCSQPGRDVLNAKSIAIDSELMP